MELFLLAYLDPGTGTIIVQTLIAGLAGIAVLFKTFWRQIVAFFDKIRKLGKKATNKK